MLSELSLDMEGISKTPAANQGEEIS